VNQVVNATADSHPLRLSPRQREVAAYVAAGLTDEEIARSLSISRRTVRMHCDAIRAKLSVARRRDIPVAYRLQTGRDALEFFEHLNWRFELHSQG
jgi:DNA-binding CsgD family transcriptional regulator